MNILVVEDDFVSRNLLTAILNQFGKCDVAVDGQEAVDAFERALNSNEPYNLVCLDIMLPKMDGQEVLKRIRAIENEKGIQWGDKEKSATVIMTTALQDSKNFMQSMRSGCEAYLPKPITKTRLMAVLREIGVL